MRRTILVTLLVFATCCFANGDTPLPLKLPAEKSEHTYVRKIASDEHERQPHSINRRGEGDDGRKASGPPTSKQPRFPYKQHEKNNSLPLITLPAQRLREGWENHRHRPRPPRPLPEGPRGEGGEGSQESLLWRILRQHFDLGPISIGWDFTGLFGPSEKEGDQGEKVWWLGPNVCIQRKEEITDEESSSSSRRPRISPHHAVTMVKCDEAETSYKCVTTTHTHERSKVSTVVYECCHGYQRITGEPGCPLRLKLQDLLKTTEELGAAEFIRALNSSEVVDELLRGGENYTIFAPINKAFENLQRNTKVEEAPSSPDQDDVVIVSPESRERAIELSQIVPSHIVPGLLRTSDLRDEQLLPTELSDDIRIRFNIYGSPQEILTANCVPITSTDNQATNGIVHLVERILPVVNRTIMEIIESREDLSTLFQFISKASIAREFRKPGGQLTLLAPTNAAFKRRYDVSDDDVNASGITMSAGTTKEENTCMEHVLENHVLPNVICTTAIQGKAKTINVLKQFLNVTRDESDKILFNGKAQIVVSDLVGTNGVVQIIDEVLVPKEALDLLQVAKENGASEFSTLVEGAGLKKAFQQLRDITLFLPTDEAFKELPKDVVQRLESDPMERQRVVKYHVAMGEMSTLQLRDSSVLKTMENSTGRSQLLVKQYSSFPFARQSRTTVQCATLLVKNLQSCNGMIHVIDKVLLPPKGNVLDTLYQHPQFKIFASLLNSSKILGDLTTSTSLTIFAPTNDAFKALGDNTLRKLRENKQNLADFLKSHIVNGQVCCAAAFESTIGFMKTSERSLDGGSIKLHRAPKSKKVLVNGKEIVEQCDIPATNGVIHSLNAVLPNTLTKHCPSCSENKKVLPDFFDGDLVFEYIFGGIGQQEEAESSESREESSEKEFEW